jgi:hypothetical protein
MSDLPEKSVCAKSVGDHLENLARKRKTITYSDLLEAFDLPPVTQDYMWGQSPMPKVFGELDRHDSDNNLPLRTSVVVLKTNLKIKSSVPGNGYFKTLCNYRETLLPQSINEKRKAHCEELTRLHKAYPMALEPPRQSITV